MSAELQNERILRLRVELVTQDLETGEVRFSTPIDWVSTEASPIGNLSMDRTVPQLPQYGWNGIRGFVSGRIEQLVLHAERGAP